MNGDPLLDRVRRANPAREEQFPPDPGRAAQLRSRVPPPPPRTTRRWRSVAAAVAGVAAIGALIAVLPRGNDAPPPSPAGEQTTAMSPTPGPGGGPAAAPIVEVSVWIARDAAPGAVDALRARLDRLVATGSAESVSHVSAAERLEELRGRLHDPSILDELPRNPMPASFEVRTSHAAAVQAATEGDPAIDRALGVTVHPARVAPRRP